MSEDEQVLECNVLKNRENINEEKLQLKNASIKKERYYYY